mgnify:CR=1 FL=1
MSSMAIALLILAVTIVLFIWEPVPIIVTAIGHRLRLHRHYLCRRYFQGLQQHDHRPVSGHDGSRFFSVPHGNHRRNRPEDDQDNREKREKHYSGDSGCLLRVKRHLQQYRRYDGYGASCDSYVSRCWLRTV